MSERDKIIDKIRRLQEVTVENGASPEEAESFAAKAAEMMARHAVDQSEITAPPEHKMDIREVKYLNPWRRDLLEAIARVCFVQVLYSRGTCDVTLVGRPLNIEAFYEMFRFIERQCVEIARDLFPGSDQRKAQRRAEGGLAAGVTKKLFQHHMKNADALLPVVQELKAAKAAMDDIIGADNIAPLKEPERVITQEFVHGAQHADRIKLREDID